MDIVVLLKQVPATESIIAVSDDGKSIYRKVSCKHFVDAMELMTIIADIAESEGHHPEILTEWGRVKVVWWTHKIKGLHRNDFICAAKTDVLYG